MILQRNSVDIPARGFSDANQSFVSSDTWWFLLGFGDDSRLLASSRRAVAMLFDLRIVCGGITG